ncbi:MAG: HD domain-containing protein [Nitrospirae bacterium]|nr:MAG: HD domain-containing protein [Nitrospirota bacterium]
MREADAEQFKEWFSGYTKTFHSDDKEEQKNIALKIRHTSEVCSVMRQLAAAMFPDENSRLVAEAAALFHDVGRFPQYAEYKTFRDSISVNHGKLGAEVLVRERVLAGLPEHEQAVILQAVQFHNAFEIPGLKDGDALMVLKMVRDADKLDIWRIYLGFYEGDPADIASEAGLGLPDLPGYSDPVLESIFNRQTASLKDLRCLNDFTLMLLSWTYDLNFTSSAALLAEKGYVSRLISLLPQTPDVLRAREELLSYLRARTAP